MTIPIKVICNYDKYKLARWPDELIIPPRIGEYLLPISGQPRLKICGVTHAYNHLVLDLVSEDGKAPT